MPKNTPLKTKAAQTQLAVAPEITEDEKVLDKVTAETLINTVQNVKNTNTLSTAKNSWKSLDKKRTLPVQLRSILQKSQDQTTQDKSSYNMSATRKMGSVIGLASLILGALAMLTNSLIISVAAILLGLVAIYAGLGWKGKIFGYIGTLLGAIGLLGSILGGVFNILIQLLIIAILILLVLYLIKRVF